MSSLPEGPYGKSPVQQSSRRQLAARVSTLASVTCRVRRAAERGIAIGLIMGLAACGGSSADDSEPVAVVPGATPTPTTGTGDAAPPTAASGIFSPDPYHATIAAAGYVDKVAQINQLGLHYSEGPSNGPPLVMLHAQMLDTFSYSRVMADLAKSYHVFVVDYPGHGQTTAPTDYTMKATQIGADLSDFISHVIGQPIFLTGNSSGGLLAMWLAANRPQQVKAVLLEDPPLFSSEYPRIKTTVANRAFATSYSAVTQDHPDDFLLYFIDKNAAFFATQSGAAAPLLLTQAVLAYRKVNPGQPVELTALKNDEVEMLIRGLDQYDPHFGSAFYDGTWNEGFDHAAALSRIECPVLLMQANFTIEADGTLNGAMDQADADRAMSLLKNGTYLKVDSDHVVNLANPDTFISTLNGFFKDKS
jgi:pimeloyl-ACP methyl ester carboxylesterase